MNYSQHWPLWCYKLKIKLFQCWRFCPQWACHRHQSLCQSITDWLSRHTTNGQLCHSYNCQDWAAPTPSSWSSSWWPPTYWGPTLLSSTRPDLVSQLKLFNIVLNISFKESKKEWRHQRRNPPSPPVSFFTTILSSVIRYLTLLMRVYINKRNSSITWWESILEEIKTYKINGLLLY